MTTETYDAVVVGGGPAGATAAESLARSGRSVLLLDRAGRVKPCGGAVPPRLIADFTIPDDLIVAKIKSARMVAPSNRTVVMPIDGGYVGMVDRDIFDEWLRDRAAAAGAERTSGTFERLEHLANGTVRVVFTPKIDGRAAAAERSVVAKAVIGADGALSAVAKQCVPGADKMPFVFAYHEIVRTPKDEKAFDGTQCDVWYQGEISPDFYGWVFPHGDVTSVGVGSAQKGFSLREATGALRRASGLGGAQTVRREGAPIPLKPLKRWDDGRNVVLAGDAAGVVAPASGEGIYYAMEGGRLAAKAAEAFLATGNVKSLALARKAFMRSHGRVFLILRIMQHFWYVSDERRERFVAMCRDPDVQRLTWEAYMNKKLVWRSPMAHVRIFLRDMGHLLRLVSPWRERDRLPTP